MKKTIGIILIVVAVLNIITWIPGISRGKTEGGLYYIFIIAMLGGGIYLVMEANKKPSK